MRVPRTAKRSNQSILKEINHEYSMEGLLVTEAAILWPPDVKRQLLEKILMLGKIEGMREGGDRG